MSVIGLYLEYISSKYEIYSIHEIVLYEQFYAFAE